MESGLRITRRGVICFAICCLTCIQVSAAARWTGIASNGRWDDATNWENGLLPAPDDDVVLDNSLYAFSYTVTLPDLAVTVRSIKILPGAAQQITLVLPVSNTVASPGGSIIDRAVNITGTDDCLHIGRGGSFINASGSSSGYSLALNDSMRIDNGGSYIHRSRTGHAEIVEMLCRHPGTEKGIFRFENTDAASVVSLSNRIYGTLQLSAAYSTTGTVSYSAAGTNPVIIRGDLQLEAGSSLSLNFDDTLLVGGNLIIQSAILNLANSNRSSTLRLMGNWMQTGGTILESSPVQQTGKILMNGVGEQIISVSGQIIDSIAVVVNNKAGIVLQTPLVLPYRLELKKGAISTDPVNLLVLQPTAISVVDSLSNESYINGPVKKLGLTGSPFLFPTGAPPFLRWIQLSQFTGDATVTYHRNSALDIGTNLGSGLDHVSQVEYWSIESTPNQSAQVKLSFDDQTSGGVSELVSLRVAAFDQSRWTDAGNTATSGAAFSNGSVTSNLVPGAGSAINYFTLASSSAFTNILPIFIEQQWMNQWAGGYACHWIVPEALQANHFELELSEDGIHFTKAITVAAIEGETNYKWTLPPHWNSGFCRIRTSTLNENYITGESMRFGNLQHSAKGIQVFKSHGSPYLQLIADKDQLIGLELFDNKGSLIKKGNYQIPKGAGSVLVSDHSLPAGIYTIRVISKNQSPIVRQLIF